MLLRARSKTALCLSVVSFLFTPAIATHRQDAAPVETRAAQAPDRQVIDRALVHACEADRASAVALSESERQPSRDSASSREKRKHTADF